MIPLITQSLIFLHSLSKAIIREPEIRSVGILLLLLLTASTLFFVQVEGWSWLDSLYFSVMTVSTIGYGAGPEAAISKIFTMLLAFLGVGLFGLFVVRLSKVRSKPKVRHK